MNGLSRGERFKDARTVYNTHGKQTMQEVSAATGVAASCIKDLEDDAIGRSVGYDKVASLARHYGVSADWLMGLSEIRTSDPAIRAICDYTGLTDAAVDILHQLRIPSFHESREAVNSLLGWEHLPEFLFALHRIRRSKNEVLSSFKQIDSCNFSEASRGDIENLTKELTAATDKLDLSIYKFQGYAKELASQVYELQETANGEMRLKYFATLRSAYIEKWNDEHIFQIRTEDE